jgi:hypothetical protein
MTESVRRLRRHYDRTDTSAELASAEPVEPGEGRMVGITIRLPQATLDAARAVADEEGVKVTALLRAWVEQRLAERVDDRSMVPVADLRRLNARAARRHPG